MGSTRWLSAWLITTLVQIRPPENAATRLSGRLGFGSARPGMHAPGVVQCESPVLIPDTGCLDQTYKCPRQIHVSVIQASVFTEVRIVCIVDGVGFCESDVVPLGDVPALTALVEQVIAQAQASYPPQMITMLGGQLLGNQVCTFDPVIQGVPLGDLTDSSAAMVASALNGFNGEVTGKDDVKKMTKAQKRIAAAARMAVKQAMNNSTGIANSVSAVAGAAGVPPVLLPMLKRLTKLGVDALGGMIQRRIASGPGAVVITGGAISDKPYKPPIDTGRFTYVNFEEPLGPLLSTGTGFSVFQLGGLTPANPLLSQTHAAAVGFQRHRPMTAVLIFVTATTENQAGLGSVILGCYEPGTVLPSTLFAAEQLGPSIMVGKSDVTMAYAIELDTTEVPAQGFKNVFSPRLDPTPDSGCFPCNLMAATDSTAPAGTKLGDLFLVSRWKLWDPAYGPSVRSGRFKVLSTGFSGGSPFGGTFGTPTSYGNLVNCSLTSTTLTVNGLVPGDIILITLRWAGTTTATTVFPATSNTNSSYVNVLSGNTASSTSTPAAGSVTATWVFQTALQFSGSLGTALTYTLQSGGTYPGGTTTLETVVDLMPVGVPSSLV